MRPGSGVWSGEPRLAVEPPCKRRVHAATGDLRLAASGGEREPGCPIQARQGEPDVSRAAEYKNSISQPTEIRPGAHIG